MTAILERTVRPADHRGKNLTQRSSSKRRHGPPAPGVAPIGLVAFTLLCVVLAFTAVFSLVLSGVQEQRSQHQLYASLRGLLDAASPVAPNIGGVIAHGSPVALLDVPAVHVSNLVIVEGTTAGDLQKGPGHLRDTPLPGQVGDSVVFGRSVTAGAPFRAIRGLHVGDRLTVITGQGSFHYAVIGRRLPGQPLPSYRSDSGLLTLVTSDGGHGIGILQADHLVYVDARLEETAVAAPPGRPRSVGSNEDAGGVDSSALPWVGAWALVLLATAGMAGWCWRRFGLLRTWLIAGPVALGVMWALSTEITRLLPNVY